MNLRLFKKHTDRMKFSHVLSFLAIVIVVLSIFSTGTGCANMAPPTGGPRDSLPPGVIQITPKDSALSFNSKKIIFTFDEYVQVDEVQKNVIFNPTPKINPTVESKLKTVLVTIRYTI
jgi:hypothetical protein